MVENVKDPPRHGEGDHAEHGGGGGSHAAGPLRQPAAATSGRVGPSGGRSASGRSSRGGISSAYLVALVILITDQFTKWLVTVPLQLQSVRQIVLLPFFNLTWTENRGISLGLLHATSPAMRWGLVALTAAIAIGVAVWIIREKRVGDQVALGLVLGGAIGNIMDRSRFGYVVDFADLHFGDFRPFLVFNVADAAISIGVVILLLRAFLLRPERPEEKIEHA